MENLKTINEMNFKIRYNTQEILAFHDAILVSANIATPAVLSCTPEIFENYAKTVSDLQGLVHNDYKSQYTSLISDEDEVRDDCLTTVYALIDAYANSPIAEMAEAGEMLRQALRFYRNATRSALAAETVEIKGLLEVLSADNMKNAIATISHLDTLIADLETSNNKIESLMNLRSSEEKIKALNNDKRYAAQIAYNAIVLRANASVVLLPSEALNTFVTEANNIINRTKQVYSQRMGRLHSDKEGNEKDNN